MVKNTYEEITSFPPTISIATFSDASSSMASDAQPTESFVPRASPKQKKRKPYDSALFLTEAAVAISAFELIVSLFWLFVTFCWGRIRAIS